MLRRNFPIKSPFHDTENRIGAAAAVALICAHAMMHSHRASPIMRCS
jgi:hypothetical protein